MGLLEEQEVIQELALEAVALEVQVLHVVLELVDIQVEEHQIMQLEQIMEKMVENVLDVEACIGAEEDISLVRREET